MGTTTHTTIPYETRTDRRKSATVVGVASVFDYDASGRLRQRTDTVDGKAFVVVYDCDARDNLTDITYPTGRHVKVDYDSEKRVSRVYSVATPNTSYAYE